MYIFKMELTLREKKSKNAAEEASRPDLSQAELDALMARHASEVDALADRMDSQRQRQQRALHEKLAEQRKRRMEELRRRQDAELMSEMLEQKKELDSVKLQQALQVN